MSSTDPAPPGTDTGPGTAASAPAAPIREDQVQNAVSFLTHPNVRTSPVAARRSFLERKGLTAAEIDEALRRVPDAPASASPTVAPQGPPGATLSYLNQTPASSAPTTTALVPAVIATPQLQAAPVQPPPPQPLRWSQIILGLGAVTASVVLVQSFLLPRALAFARSWWDAAREREERAQKRERDTAAVLETLQAVQADLRSTIQSLSDISAAVRDQTGLVVQQQRRLADGPAAISGVELRQELRGLAMTLAENNGSAELRRELKDIRAALQAAQRAPRAADAAGAAGDTATVGRAYGAAGYAGSSSSHDAHATAKPWEWAAGPDATAASGGGGFDAGMHARYGTLASGMTRDYGGISGVNGGSVTGASGARLVQAGVVGNGSSAASPPPTMTTWGRSPGDASGVSSPSRDGSRGSFTMEDASAQKATGGGGVTNGGGGRAADADAASYPPSFHEVMDMVARGVTPPNVRTDINDQPPDPQRPPSDARLAMRPKPWEMQPQAQAMQPQAHELQQDGSGEEGHYGSSGGGRGRPSIDALAQVEGVQLPGESGTEGGVTAAAAAPPPPPPPAWRPPPPPQPTISPSSRQASAPAGTSVEAMDAGPA